MIAGRIAASVAQRQVKYVTPVSPAAARGLVADVYAQVVEDFRIVVPPAMLHSPAPRVLAGYWMLLRETMVASGAVDRHAKELVASAVSVANICPYCVDMHTAALYGLDGEGDADAIALDRTADVQDPRTRALVEWGRAAHLPDDPAHAPAPFPEAHRAELVGVAVSMHYLTRMVNVFLPGFLLPPRLNATARRRFKRGVGRVLAPTLHGARPAGLALPMLPPADPPASAAWAFADAGIAAAVARSYAAFTEAGERVVPVSVRELLSREVLRWRGAETGISRDWCEDLLLELPEPDRSAGRLALLTAFASYQVDAEAVGEYRRVVPADDALIELVAWSAFTAARRVGELHLPAGSRVG
ncbi:carboxymuconolactone decarboxylase family protein [Dactylosporangium sp. NPDC051485]|uniref:carboxymuconolactone decarboxylase family protein n=1 Tax=Dactylosporangium sp. NPDC051485 TaxID=3154846 RepID=UPI00341D1C8B